MSDCPFRYQGQYEDIETGLYYNRFRYYSPDTGTYISQDPIGLAGGMPNMYSYVINSNLYVDTLGLIHEFGIATYASPLHAKDNLSAHELLQNAWIRHNHGVTRNSALAGRNPTIALQEGDMHKKITRLQRKHGMFNKANLMNQTAMQNINRNTALTRRGIYDDLIERGWEHKNAKRFATERALALRSEAIEYAKKEGFIKKCH